MSLTIELSLPEDVELRLRQQRANLSEDAREAYAVDLYRRGAITHAQLAGALGLDRFATDGVLKRHGVAIELEPSEFADELADLRRLLTP